MFSSYSLRAFFTTVSAIVSAVLVVSGILPGKASAIELESFTQPYASIDVPAAEMGVLAEILVREGGTVRQGQLVARLDDTVLQVSKSLAQASRDAVSSQRAAEAERSLTEQQLRSYRELFTAGNATQREVDRAENNFWQATTRLLAVQEDMQIRDLELKRISAQIQQRRIASPLNGVVLSITKDVGEFVSPTDPVVMQIVQLDRLKVIFSVPVNQVDQWETNQRVSLQTGFQNLSTTGVIETIAPVADAESASVRVTVRIENSDGKLRSGVVCRWDLERSPASFVSEKAKNVSGALKR
ncbi:efflux RND transporter periplasmic adaptor subunit [Neorhodopirellula pilleata]|uniref:Periplasmic multidrug efflux lipoprotein n=1 Tax=Neorhodopirellula pilleata TaxID=2714738 RepID=A0A5C6AWI8_9BACT|nr:efflux RND transporter periplasmic adaptor subunit [Neorhodopirellula pilleata]TWU03831.1 periplasmic multidrug efflux lipoprotein precursor [Neorhodopirellula pilleata]